MRAVLVVALFTLGASSLASAQETNGGIVPVPTYQSTTPTRPAPTPPPATNVGIGNPPGNTTQPIQGGVVSPMPPAAPATTASEQGYDADAVPVISSWDEETLRSRESARQSGDRIEAPARHEGTAAQLGSDPWLHDWMVQLVAIGVHPDKVVFEANRLTRQQFALWASRQVWAVEEGLILP